MPDSDTIRETEVKEAVALLRDLSEEQRETWLPKLPLTPVEKEEVKKRLWTPPPAEKKPEKLREMEAFQRLTEDVRRGKAILFLGAGVSLDAGMPSSSALVDAVLALARSYRIEVEEERQYTLPAIAGWLERAGFRREVIETLKGRIEDAYNQPDLPPHRRGVFRLLPYLDEINKVILTTNWDELIERALQEAGEPATVIRRDRELGYWAAARHAIVKLHGDFTEPRTIVVSDSDYNRVKAEITRPGAMAGSLWGLVGTLFAQYSCIFAGYRYADEDIKLLRLLIASRQMEAEVRNYMVGPFSANEQQALKDWAQMEVIPATAGEFLVALGQELAQFANRLDDLDRIFRREAAPFIEAYAPFGAGKHALLDEVERQARARDQGWKPEQIIRIDLREVSHPPTTAELTAHLAKKLNRPWIERAEELGPALRDRGRVLLLFENTEAIEEGWPAFTDLVSGVIAPTVRDLNREGKRSRLILAGRYPVEGWPFSFKRYAEVFPLAPFQRDAVWDMVRKYVLANDPTARTPLPPRELARQIYDVTGRSNPGFIKQILEDLMKKSKRPDGSFDKLPMELTEQEIDGYLASFAKAIHEKVWAVAPPGVEGLFIQGLCVLRRLNPGLLARLAEDDTFQELFAQAGGPEAVLGALKACHLLRYEFPLEVVDPVIRRIQSEPLRRRDRARFASAHEAAASAWQVLLSSSSITDQICLAFFREWLYHRVSCLWLDGQPQKSHWQALEQQIEAIPFRTSQPYPIGMGQALLQEIEEKRERDEELLDVLLDCLGERHYEDLRRQLIDKPEVTS